MKEKKKDLGDALKEPIERLKKQLKEDLSKPINKDLILNIGGVRVSKDSLEAREKAIETIREQYDNIKEVLKHYIDLKEDYYTILTLWIIGTYLHDEFDTFPYLFFNAMRGSGKSRTLRLACKLAKDGNVMASPTEAVLFRVHGTLGIDEFEGVANKDKSQIRELLNGAYKRGVKIFRMKKKKSLAGEELVAEEFEPYRPIIMANITGMEEVLEDRCITLILEKSSHPEKTRLTEDFESNSTIKYILQNMNQCSLCSVVMKKNINSLWNNYISNRYNTTHTTHTTYTTPTTLTTPETVELEQLFNKIHDSEIIGRALELCLPLFFIADIISPEILEKTIEITKKMTAEKKKEQGLESVDVMVLDFVSREQNELVFNSVKELTHKFGKFADEPVGGDWLNPKWFGRALKRLNLIVDKKRKGYGIEVILNVSKAIEKFRMFKKEEK